MRRLCRLLLPLTLCALSLPAAKEDPVQWTLKPGAGNSQVAPGSKLYLELTASIQPGWHLYSPTTPAGGPIITKIKLNDNPAVLSYNVFRPQPVRKLDPNFQLETETYTNGAIFLIEAATSKSASGKSSIEAVARYQACTDTKCLNPVQKTATTEIVFSSGALAASFSIPPGYALVRAPGAPSQSAAQTSAAPIRSPERSDGLLPFLLTAFGFGLAALFTPCVFPMIPITVSFFLNQSARTGDQPQRNGWTQALVFCLGIIGLFTG